jgi:hypothetical protein
MKLREIVSNFIYSQDSSIHSFARIYELAKFGFKTEFNLDIRSTIKTVLLTINPNKSVQLPDDYISYNKIGIVNADGEFVTLKVNNKLVTYHEDYYNNTNNLTALPTLPSFGVNVGINGYGYNSLLYFNYWYGGTSYNLFGLGSGTADVGEYKVDDVNKIILFNPTFVWSQVLLEYVSSGCDDGFDDYEVDIRCAEAMRAYIRWANAVDMTKKYSQSQIDTYWRAFNNEKRKARMRINPIILNEMQNAERRSWKIVPKA